MAAIYNVYISSSQTIKQRRSWCPCLLPSGSKFWICIPGASTINLKVKNWSGRYKADREFGYLQINVSSNSACAQGGSIYIIWIRHKADESNTDWCKFYKVYISWAKIRKILQLGLLRASRSGRKVVAMRVQSLTRRPSRFLSTPARKYSR